MIDIDPLTRTSVVPVTPIPKDRRSRTAGGTAGPLTPSAAVGGGGSPNVKSDRSFFGTSSIDNDNQSQSRQQQQQQQIQSQYYEGPPLIIESEHPYRHNTNEYTTVAIPNAVSYCITFSENTRTEAIYDYIKFYDDDTHTEHFGSGRWCLVCVDVLWIVYSDISCEKQVILNEYIFSSHLTHDYV